MAPDASDALAVRQKVQLFLNAARTGSLDLLQKLAPQLDEGKGLARTVTDVKDANKRGAIHFAAREGKTKVCKYLLEELKLDVDSKDKDGETPLIHATRQGHTETAKYLLEGGADPSISSELGATALHHAAGIGDIALLKFLLERGVDVDLDSDAGTPLIWAAGHAQPEAVKVLLDHHANPNTETDDNITPLLSAVAAGSLSCLEALIKAGAKVNIVAGGATPLHIAADNGSSEIINCLLEAGGDPNKADEDGLKPIQVATGRGNRLAVEILLSVTSTIPTILKRSVDGITEHMQAESRKLQEEVNKPKETRACNDPALSHQSVSEMHPGPRTHDVLYDQNSHRSERVWEEGCSSNNVLTCRRMEASIKRCHEMDPRMDVYLRQAGFYGVSKLPFIQLDWGLITALVERWRPETHTFHMRHGEMTITLEDIAVQFGIPVDGNAVIGSSSFQWAELCHRLLGAVPECSAISYGRLKMKWLTERFNGLPDYATDEQVKQYTRAHILQLIGGMLFADKSQNRVHLMYLPLLEDFEQAGTYSWGSACLAWLYRQLCRASSKDATQIAGPLILLQVWAWDRFPHISPRRRRHVLDEGMPLANRWGVNFDVKAVGTHVLSQYREAFDRQSLKQVIWRPYTEDILRQLPAYCFSGRGIWRARVPLICFCVVEWHHPDRVIRQFGGTQVIPEGCNTNKQKALHKIDLRGKHLDQWDHIHREYLDAWNSRMDSLAALEGEEQFVYSHWYASISRPTISHAGTMLSHLASEMEKMLVTLEKGDPEKMWTVVEAIRRCRSLLEEHTAVRLHGRNDEQYRP